LDKKGSIITNFDIKKDIVETADVCVIGSGAGGATLSALLAEEGLDVVILEEGGYHPSKEFTQKPTEMIPKLYRDAGGSVIMGKPVIAFAEGRCVGGSTVINGGMCWRIPERILKRWKWEFGLDDFTPEKLDKYYAPVEKRINVAVQSPESIGKGDKLFKEAAESLGYLVKPNTRNQKNCPGLNICIFGCPGDCKQSMLVTYVPDAVNNGARLYSDARAVEIKRNGARVTEVRADILDRVTMKKKYTLSVKAKVIVLACGAIQTPVLMLRNRLANSSKQVGRNFFCHPNMKLTAIFNEDIYYWKGVHQAYQIHEFIDEGIIMATGGVHPAMVAMSQPFIGKKHLEIMMNYNRMVTAGALVDDTTSGIVKPGPFGTALMLYQIDEEETRRLVRATALLCEIFFTAGAKKIYLPFRHLESINSIEEIKKLYEYNIKASDFHELITVHAMGTCRMGADQKRFVTNSWGQTYDIPNLFIADASLFPTSIGVNPQLTIMALARRCGEYIIENRNKF
jgi:choline dehydrogenase-like flavoprotein